MLLVCFHIKLLLIPSYNRYTIYCTHTLVPNLRITAPKYSAEVKNYIKIYTLYTKYIHLNYHINSNLK